MDKLAELIGKLAVTVGVQVERLWPQIVYVYWLRSLVEIASTPPLILLLFFAAAKVWARAQRLGKDHFGGLSESAMIMSVGAVVLVVGGSILSFIYLAALPGLIATVVAPEASFVLNRLPK